MSSPIPTFVLVGHCGADSFLLNNVVRRLFPDAAVENPASSKQLDEVLSREAVVLVNRVLEHGFGTPSGIELIEQILNRDDPPKVLLISNFDDAQQAAKDAGAMPGFGKAHVYDPKTEQRLQDAVRAAASTQPSESR